MVRPCLGAMHRLLFCRRHPAGCLPAHLPTLPTHLLAASPSAAIGSRCLLYDFRMSACIAKWGPWCRVGGGRTVCGCHRGVHVEGGADVMWRPETDDDLADLHEALADRWRVKVVTVLCERGEMTHGQ